MAYRFLALTVALAMTASPVLAQQPAACGDRDDVLAQLKEKHKESPAGFGMTGNGAVVELMTSESGSWTLLLSFPNGRSCLIGAGEGWELWGAKKVAGKDA